MQPDKVFSRIRRFAEGIGVSSVGMLIALAYQIMIARMMGPENFGIYTYAIAIIIFSTVILDLGVYQSTGRFISVRLGAGEEILGLIRTTFIFTIITSLVVTLAALTVLELGFSASVYYSAIKTFTFFIPVVYFFRWTSAVLKGTGHNIKLILVEQLLFNSLLVILVVPAWYYYQSIDLAIMAVGGAYLLSFLLAITLVCKNLPDSKLEKKDFPIMDLVRHGIPLNFTTMGNRLFRRGDIIVIGALLTPQYVGLYKAIYTIISGIKQLVGPINNFSLFYISRQVGKGSMESVYKEYHLAVWVSALITIPAFCVLIVLNEPIYQLIYGEKYIIDQDVIFYLILGFVFFSCIGPVGSLFNAIGRNWIRMAIVVSIGLLNILLNYLLIKAIGLPGAALATLVSMFLLTCCYTFIVVKQSGIYFVPGLICISFLATGGLWMAGDYFTPGLVYYMSCLAVLVVFHILMLLAGKRQFLPGGNLESA
jgi:O-antigen/teichoic acid export membrane protein